MSAVLSSIAIVYVNDRVPDQHVNHNLFLILLLCVLFFFVKQIFDVEIPAVARHHVGYYSIYSLGFCSL
jgi:hypothetical protein